MKQIWKTFQHFIKRANYKEKQNHAAFVFFACIVMYNQCKLHAREYGDNDMPLSSIILPCILGPCIVLYPCIETLYIYCVLVLYPSTLGPDSLCTYLIGWLTLHTLIILDIVFSFVFPFLSFVFPLSTGGALELTVLIKERRALLDIADADADADADELVSQ